MSTRCNNVSKVCYCIFRLCFAFCSVLKSTSVHACSCIISVGTVPLNTDTDIQAVHYYFLSIVGSDSVDLVDGRTFIMVVETTSTVSCPLNSTSQLTVFSITEQLHVFLQAQNYISEVYKFLLCNLVSAVK